MAQKHFQFQFKTDRAEFYSGLHNFIHAYITDQKAKSNPDPDYICYRNIIVTLERMIQELST
jgi:hypothetical protein